MTTQLIYKTEIRNFPFPLLSENFTKIQIEARKLISASPSQVQHTDDVKARTKQNRNQEQSLISSLLKTTSSFSYLVTTPPRISSHGGGKIAEEGQTSKTFVLAFRHQTQIWHDFQRKWELDISKIQLESISITLVSENDVVCFDLRSVPLSPFSCQLPSLPLYDSYTPHYVRMVHLARPTCVRDLQTSLTQNFCLSQETYSCRVSAWSEHDAFTNPLFTFLVSRESWHLEPGKTQTQLTRSRFVFLTLERLRPLLLASTETKETSEGNFTERARGGQHPSQCRVLVFGFAFLVSCFLFCRFL